MHVIRNSWTNYVRSDLSKKEHRGGVFKRLQPPLENRVLLEVEVDVQNVVVRAVQVAVALVASSPTSRSSGRGLAVDSSRPCLMCQFCGERGRGRGDGEGE